MGIVENAERWMEIREIRNSSVHEYKLAGLEGTMERAKALAPWVKTVVERALAK